MVKPFVCNTSLYLWNALKEGKTVLLEGQLGTLKDPDHGIYPMVTSSSTLAAYGAIGAGLPPYEITKIVTLDIRRNSARISRRQTGSQQRSRLWMTRSFRISQTSANVMPEFKINFRNAGGILEHISLRKEFFHAI